MNEAEVQELIDKVVAGRLTREEQQRWSALLAQRPELEEEAALGNALRALPQPPAVSSNFTSLVMQEIQRSEPRSQSWWERFRLPRLARIGALGTAMVLVAFTLIQKHNRELERQFAQAEEAAQTVATAQAVTHWRGVETENALEVFQNFEAIRQLPPNTPGVDTALLGALAK
jgi:hypothetical protein